MFIFKSMKKQTFDIFLPAVPLLALMAVFFVIGSYFLYDIVINGASREYLLPTFFALIISIVGSIVIIGVYIDDHKKIQKNLKIIKT